MAKITVARIFEVLRAALSLKCPHCGEGELFSGFFKMHSNCAHCELKFEREQGFFVGAIYMNYAATVLIVIPGFFLFDYYMDLSPSHQLLLWGGFAIGFPILFFRHSRSLWLSVAYLLDPGERPALRLARSRPNERL